MNALKSLTLIILPLLLSGCASWSFFSDPVKPVEIQSKAIERTPLNLPDPIPLDPLPIKWIVITPENAEEVWKTLKDKNEDLVLFALTDNGYEQISINMAAIRNFIDKQRIIIINYKDYYEKKSEK